MTRRPCWISKLQFFSHNLYEKKGTFQLQMIIVLIILFVIMEYPWGPLSQSEGNGGGGGGEESLVWISKPVVLLIEEETMSLLEFIYHNWDCPCRCHSFNPSLVVCCHFICLISSNCLFSHQLSLMSSVSLLTSIPEWPKQQCLPKALWIEKLMGNWRIAVKNTVLIGQAIFSQMNWLELLSPHNYFITWPFC